MNINIKSIFNCIRYARSPSALNASTILKTVPNSCITPLEYLLDIQKQTDKDNINVKINII